MQNVIIKYIVIHYLLLDLHLLINNVNENLVECNKFVTQLTSFLNISHENTAVKLAICTIYCIFA